jgi:arylsulfatase A-like enzyme
MRASSVMPSITLPCHMSIFQSVPPGRHGVMSNEWEPLAPPLPGLFEQAHAAGLRCASLYNWEPLRNVSRPGSLDFAYFREGAETHADADHLIAREAARYLATSRPHFAFVYFGTIDTAGHTFGWMSAAYLQQLAYVDQALGVVLDALPPNARVLVQSDHGGHDYTHGTDAAEDMTIPWMISGPTIRKGYEMQTEVSLLDTAPTLARILNIPVSAHWEGRCVSEVFEEPPLF